MRRSVMILAAMAAFALGAAPALAQGWQPPRLHQAQYAAPGYDNSDEERWQRREEWRQMRRERDEARIAEAARQEAMRIEAEREERRAWRRAQRGQQQSGWSDGAPEWQRKY